MLTLSPQNSNLFAGSLTGCFSLRRDALLLGVSSSASTEETELVNTEEGEVFQCFLFGDLLSLPCSFRHETVRRRTDQNDTVLSKVQY
jgi:hypothetical protein